MFWACFLECAVRAARGGDGIFDALPSFHQGGWLGSVMGGGCGGGVFDGLISFSDKSHKDFSVRFILSSNVGLPSSK